MTNHKSKPKNPIKTHYTLIYKSSEYSYHFTITLSKNNKDNYPPNTELTDKPFYTAEEKIISSLKKLLHRNQFLKT